MAGPHDGDELVGITWNTRVPHVDVPPSTGVRSGTFVDDADTAWQRYVWEFLSQRAPVRTFDLLFDFDPDPLVTTCPPRGLFSRETWRWIRRVVAYSWRQATGPREDVVWRLDGLKLWSVSLGVMRGSGVS